MTVADQMERGVRLFGETAGRVIRRPEQPKLPTSSTERLAAYPRLAW